ncbi:MAG TPA: cobalt-precorrin-6A reductase [Stellaceae bacterium]|nr:cobalt-precorrin-6A reductase [Stellaceae bacterium]
MPAPETPAVLILGGTAEAGELARELAQRYGERLRVITSLAGRTARPAPLPGIVRSGGFGGASGLDSYLHAERIALLVDATHPFAVAISRNARLAADAAAVPRLALVRPPWRAGAGDRWIEVTDADAAARETARIAKSAFLTIGARELAAFADLRGVRLVVRLIEPQHEKAPLGDAEFVIARPPFTLDDERRLLHRYGIEAVVAKASGGALPAKLAAARETGIPVVLLRRPPPEPGPAAVSVGEALAWIAARIE